MVAGLSTLAARVTEGLRRPLPGLGERERESAGEAEPDAADPVGAATGTRVRGTCIARIHATPSTYGQSKGG